MQTSFISHFCPINLRCVGILLIANPSAFAAPYEKVLLSDDDYAGQKISYVVDPPELNEQGKVAFVAFMSPSSANFLFTGAPGSLQILARQNDPAAGVPGQLYKSFKSDENRLTINPAGSVIFTGDVNSTNTNDNCLWSGTPGDVILIGREDGPAPDLAGEFFGNSPFFSSDTLLNGVGTTCFRSTRKGTQPSNGVWSGPPADPKVVAITGSPAPEVAVNYRDISRNALTQAGNVAFYASLNSSADKALFAGPPSALQKVFRFGEPCHGIAGANYGGGATDGITFAYFNNNLLAYSLRISGAGVNSTNDTAFWAGTPSAPQLVVRAGDLLPSSLGGGNLDGVSAFNINSQGNLLILSRRQGTTEDTLYWSPTVAGPANWTEVAREGATLPGLGIELAELFTTLAFSLSDNGEVVFFGKVSGAGVTTANDYMLMAWNPTSGTVRSVVREGQIISITTGDNRTVADFEYSGGLGKSAAMSCGVNGSGQIAFSVRFSDNTKGVMIANLPGGYSTFAATLPPGKAGPTDDANDDGVANVIAYYAGFSATDRLMVSDFLQWTGSGASIAAELKHNPAVTDVTATIQLSTTLEGAWTPGPPLVPDGTAGSIEILRATLPDQGTRGFARIAFTLD